MTRRDGTVAVVMGPSGSGKTTVGELAAEKASVRFYEGDNYHPPGNVAKIAAGVGLTNEERRPWIASITEAWRRDDCPPAVLACSALNEGVRKMLTDGFGEQVRFVMLDVPEDELFDRLSKRQGHFAKVTLLKSQLEAMDEAEGARHLDGTRPAEELAEEIAAEFSNADDPS